MNPANSKRLKTLGQRVAPPRFLLFLALLPVGFWAYRALVSGRSWADAAVVAFDFAAVVLLVSLIPLVRDADAKTLRQHAAENDANRGLILVLTTLLAAAVMAAITAEMPAARQGDPLAIGKLIGTLVAVWLFANSIYMLHYAHAYYSHDPGTGRDTGGLKFPSTQTPDYGDFAYFAFTVGMTFQTSDVEITAPTIRWVVLLQSFMAFVFNIGVITFTLNVLGGGSS